LEARLLDAGLVVEDVPKVQSSQTDHEASSPYRQWKDNPEVCPLASDQEGLKTSSATMEGESPSHGGNLVGQENPKPSESFGSVAEGSAKFILPKNERLLEPAKTVAEALAYAKKVGNA
jgi:hypothetical protein